jgi:dTDP-4-dehydrorhamnose reductase
MKSVLVLGNTGKLGCALEDAFRPGYTAWGKSSRDFDGADLDQVERVVREHRPNVVLNAVVCTGLDACEADPLRAMRVNAFLPRRLSELSNEMGFLLVHFSSDGVFDGESTEPYGESAAPRPINTYGLTKFGGDCYVRSIAQRNYVFRVSLLFGRTAKRTQFVEKMLLRIHQGQELRIADDLVCSPCFTSDIAARVRQVIEEERPFGLYHLANAGQATLYELMSALNEQLNLGAQIKRASYKDFPSPARKTVSTPLISEKLPPLRPWQEAIDDYCRDLVRRGEHDLA